MSGRSRAGALNWGHSQLKSTNNANQVKCWFMMRGETGVPGRKIYRCRAENQRTQPTDDADSGNRAREILMVGECSRHWARGYFKILLSLCFTLYITEVKQGTVPSNVSATLNNKSSRYWLWNKDIHIPRFNSASYEKHLLRNLGPYIDGQKRAMRMKRSKV